MSGKDTVAFTAVQLPEHPVWLLPLWHLAVLKGHQHLLSTCYLYQVLLCDLNSFSKKHGVEEILISILQRRKLNLREVKKPRLSTPDPIFSGKGAKINA